MSRIANRRQLAEATHRLIKKRDPDVGDIEAVTQALAQVITDAIGVECKVVVQIDRQKAADALALYEARHPRKPKA